MPERPTWAEPELQTVCESLLAQTGASRATVRLVGPADSGVTLVAEALSAGVASMRDGPQPGIIEAPTYVHLQRTRQLLVQNDLRTDPVGPPPSLIDHYRVWAQMLAPVLYGGRMVATISVHQQQATRDWSVSDRAALEGAQAKVAGWYSRLWRETV